MQYGFYAAILVGLLACDAGTTDGGGNGNDGGAGGSGGSGAGSGEGASFEVGGGGGGPPVEEVAEVFGHSPYTLFRLDPDTKVVTTVGDFDGCDSVIDIALDEDSNLYGTSATALYEIDKLTAKCTHIANGTFPNSLSFIPAGTLDPNVEALVGYVGSTYVRIDPTTGSISNIGSLGEGNLASSGDIVSVKGGQTYLTVNGGACETDCLAEINPVTGILLKNWGQLGYVDAFGIAFWAGSVYGFTNGGELFEVTFENNVLTTTLIADPPNAQFWGAGSTTSAPPTPTPE